MATGSAIRRWVKILSIALLLAFVAGATLSVIYVRIPDPDGNYQQDPLKAGSPTSAITPQASLLQREQLQDVARQQANVRPATQAGSHKQILFGDTHVHTTWSFDAFMFSLPIMNASKGAYPPAAACDYARFVSQLDFYFLTDHAESYTSQRWRDAQEAVRHCNAISGDPENPDLVAFLGFEWSQFGMTADDHYGHHNVLFRDTDENLLPLRPIGAGGAASDALRGSDSSNNPVGILQWLDSGNRSYYQALDTLLSEMREEPDCPAGIKSTELPANCYESAVDPGELYEKLAHWFITDCVLLKHKSD